jgi:hypothetical protein
MASMVLIILMIEGMSILGDEIPVELS